MENQVSEFVVALDIGSWRTRCLIAEVGEDGIRVTGRGEEASRGVRRGEIIDLSGAGYSAQKAIAAAEDQAGVSVQTLYVAAGSRHTRFANNRAIIGITREERTITPRDVKQVEAEARKFSLRQDAVAIGSLITSYCVDDVRHVSDPAGMHGTRLEAEMHVVTDSRGAVENLEACLTPELHEVEEFIFAPYAAGEAVLEEDDKKLGVALVNIGAGTTGIMVWRENVPVFSSVVPVGGDHITNDIAIGLDIGVADAAKLKEEHATAAGPLSGNITFQRVARPVTYCADARRLHAIVDCRIREILDVVRRELMRGGVRPAAIRTVLTGGTSRMPGIETLASSALGSRARVGRPKLGSEILSPDLAVAIGMLNLGAKKRKQEQDAAPVAQAGKFVTWLRQMF